MKLKEFLEVRDSISCPVLVFKTSSNGYSYIPDFFPSDEDFDSYYEYVQKHADDEVVNISLVSKGKLVGLSICIKIHK